MNYSVKRLSEISKDTRKSLVKLSNVSKSSHIGSCLSIVEILVILYFNILNHNPKRPNSSSRDRFVLSKGHACLILYIILAECGYFPKKNLLTYGKNNSNFMSHISHTVPGVEFSTGSLGHGINFGVGKAYYSFKKQLKWKVYVLISDGELNEGSTWEAFMFASHHRLSNLTIIIDDNKIQSLGNSKEIIDLNSLKSKLSKFNFDIHHINGHNLKSLKSSFDKKTKLTKIIIADTIKGKGISFMENKLLWHYKPPDSSELEKALKELS